MRPPGSYARSCGSRRSAFPCLALQTDPDLKSFWGGALHMLLGEDFPPKPWRSRIEAVMAEVAGQISAALARPDDHRATLPRRAVVAPRPSRAVVAEFRLDDDDAVAIDYVAQLRRSWPKLARLRGRTGRVALDHGKGPWLLQAHPDGRIETHALLTQCWSAGLALYLRPRRSRHRHGFPAPQDLAARNPS